MGVNENIGAIVTVNSLAVTVVKNALYAEPVRLTKSL
jgi:hypothetical protein